MVDADDTFLFINRAKEQRQRLLNQPFDRGGVIERPESVAAAFHLH
jgi:hypothetical protein